MSWVVFGYVSDLNKLAKAYREWILEQGLKGCVLSEGKDGAIDITGELVRGWVSFYDINDACIVELRLERVLDGEPAFFLHFELEDLTRAQMLFDEMASVVYDLNHHQTRQILLCCSCGMTTSFFAMKLNECATNLGLDYEFSAKSIEEAEREGSKYSAVLLAPQVGYQRKAVAEALPNTPVIELPGKVFGSYDAPSALRIVVDVLSGSRKPSNETQLHSMRDFDKTKRVLAMSYIYRKDEPTLSYRVLDKGRIAASGMLVRRTFDDQLLEDISATLRLKGWKTEEFDAVGIAVPQMVDDGIVVRMHHDGGTDRHDMRDSIGELWNTKVYVDHNATAAAVGCYVSQDEYENVAFHAQTIGVPGGEEGYVVEGKPLVGRSGYSGHLRPLANSFSLQMDLEDAAWRVDGMCELVARYVTSLACTIAPEVIYVWCDLLPYMDDLREELEKVLPPDAIPELKEVTDYDDYVLLGELALCLGRLAK